MSSPESPTPDGGWFLQRLQKLEEEARAMRDDAKVHKDAQGFSTWQAIAAALALAIIVYKST